MEHKFILVGIFITIFPVNVRKLTLDIFEYEKVTSGAVQKLRSQNRRNEVYTFLRVGSDTFF